jgi:small subunit ribosomal protein S2
MMTVDMRELLRAGVHFGHRKRYWNPKMEGYIYGVHNGVHIINLEKTVPMFEQALALVKKIAAKKGRVLFVGTKRAARDIVKQEAQRANMPYVNHRWLGGMLTNYKTIRQAVRRLKDLNVMFDKQSFAGLKKKEILMLTRERDKLERNIGGIKNMGGLPDALFVIGADHEHIAISEANRLRIPVIAIVDTNASPDNVDYVIPGNDDAMGAVRLYCQSISNTILGTSNVSKLAADFVEVVEDVAVAVEVSASKVDTTAVKGTDVVDAVESSASDVEQDTVKSIDTTD